jgi:hypothetical protein
VPPSNIKKIGEEGFSSGGPKIGEEQDLLQLFAVQQARSVFFCFGKFSREQLP